MKRSVTRAARLRVLALLVVLPLGAIAQTMKPGLWEIQHQMQLDPAQQAQMDEMRKQMAAMPEAQRKMIEQRMGSGAARERIVKVCMTKEDVERQGMPGEQRPGCTQDVKRSGNTVHVDYVCTQPPSKGTIDATFASPERYSMKMNATTEAGRPVAMQGEGRWLGADCGDVKPKTAAKP